MNQIVINGQAIQVNGGNHVSIKNGKVLVDGNTVGSFNPGGEVTKVTIRWEGKAPESVNCRYNLEIHGDVHGDVEGTNVEVQGNVTGTVRAGNSVCCGNVAGDVRAGNGVTMRRE